jgi:hypothetical protein
MIAQTKFRIFARGLEGFAPLAERSGYVIGESRTAVVSEQVLLRPRATFTMTKPSLRSRAFHEAGIGSPLIPCAAS